MTERRRFLPPNNTSRFRDAEIAYQKEQWLRARLVGELLEKESSRQSRTSYHRIFREGQRLISEGKHTPYASRIYEFMHNFPEHVLYSDEHVLAINKPPGIPSVPGAHLPFGVEGIVQYMQNLPDMYLVNRLDVDTSGVIMFGKNFDALVAMKLQFGNKESSQVKKVYLTLLEGEFDGPQEIRTTVAIAPTRTEKMQIVSPDDPSSKHSGAKTATSFFSPLILYHTLDRSPQPRTLTAVRIETGRTHQIRVTAKHLEKPVVGDRLYNPGSTGAPRQMLHSFGATFKHPSTGNLLTVEAPIPKDFNDVVEGLKRVKSYRSE